MVSSLDNGQWRDRQLQKKLETFQDPQTNIPVLPIQQAAFGAWSPTA